jgi:capsular exopolysaccharide synthesis family protein
MGREQRVEPSKHVDVEFRQFVNIVWRRWRIVAATATLCLVLSVTIMLFQQPTYRAISIVQVEEEKPRFALQPERYRDSGLISGVGAEIEIVRSRLVLEPVIRELGLDTEVQNAPANARIHLVEHLPEVGSGKPPEYTVRFGKDGHYRVFSASRRELGSGTLGRPFVGDGVSWKLDAIGAEPGDTLNIKVVAFEKSLQSLRKNIQVQEVGKQTQILSISADMPDPKLAKEVVERITQSYLAQNVARKNQEVGQILSLIDQQLRVVQGNMEREEKELNDLKTAKGVFVLSEEAKRIIDQISRMEISRAETQLQYQTVIALASRIRAAKDANPFLLGAASIDDELISELARQLSVKLVELRNLRQDFTVENPRVIAINAEIDELKQKIGASLTNVQRTLKSRLDTSDKLMAKYENQLKELPGAERELAAVARKTEVSGDLYSFLLKKHEEIRIAQAGIVGNIRVIENAAIPLMPVAPKKKRGAALGLLAGLLLGIGLAFMTNYFDDTVNTAAEFERGFGLSVYGEIPKIDIDGEPVLIHGAPTGSALHEAYRTLTTNIRFAGARPATKRIMCTSPQAGEGKTTTMVNLGIALANRGAKVLLIDCDMRRPTVHALLGLREQPGLSEAILQEGAWKEAVQKTAVAKFHVIAAGGMPPNQFELLDTAAFDLILQEAEVEYDYVLLDVPPLLAFTDAAIVSTRVDAVFVAVAARKTHAPALARTLALLRNVKAPIKGAIFTMTEANHESSDYYRAYQEKLSAHPLRIYTERMRNFFLRT